uniref:Uncharacterized protein n=1 Tax=Rhizophora mucronata TaxID=61149 RepID=A0A2P2PHL0_RHIMU
MLPLSNIAIIRTSLAVGQTSSDVQTIMHPPLLL